MKIVTKKGNLLTNVKEGWILHGCNAQGKMGSGFAKSLKEMYPGAYSHYRNEYEKTFPWSIAVGTNNVFFADGNLAIVNAITQEFYGFDSKRYVSYDAIEECFSELNNLIVQFTIPQQIHIPMIGAGLGGGNWEIIREIIEQTAVYPTTLWVL